MVPPEDPGYYNRECENDHYQKGGLHNVQESVVPSLAEVIPGKNTGSPSNGKDRHEKYPEDPRGNAESFRVSLVHSMLQRSGSFRARPSIALTCWQKKRCAATMPAITAMVGMKKSVRIKKNLIRN